MENDPPPLPGIGLKQFLTLMADFLAGGEGGAVSKDVAVLLLLQVGEPGAGRVVLAQLIAIRLAYKIVNKILIDKNHLVFFI